MTRAGLIPIAAFAVHQLRFLLAFGGGAGAELRETGHSYFHSVVPWIMLVVGLSVGGFLWSLGRAASGRRSASGRASLVPQAVARLCRVSACDLLHPGNPGRALRDGASDRDRGDLRLRRPLVDSKRNRRWACARGRYVRGAVDARRGRSQVRCGHRAPGSTGFRWRLHRARSYGFRSRRWLVAGVIAARPLFAS